MSVSISDIRDANGRLLGAGIFPAGERAGGGLELYRVAYAGDGAELTGCQVMDEFQTMSGPVMICPVTALGRMYDEALTRAFARSIDLDIGSGWPPVVIGVDQSFALQSTNVGRSTVDGIEAFVVHGPAQAVAVLVTALDIDVATLGRLAESVRGILRARLSLVLAISTAQPPTGGGRWSVQVDDAARRAVTVALNEPDGY